jgi:hypothetical protein
MRGWFSGILMVSVAIAVVAAAANALEYYALLQRNAAKATTGPVPEAVARQSTVAPSAK